jgi:hypothetical protein
MCTCALGDGVEDHSEGDGDARPPPENPVDHRVAHVHVLVCRAPAEALHWNGIRAGSFLENQVHDLRNWI